MGNICKEKGEGDNQSRKSSQVVCHTDLPPVRERRKEESVVRRQGQTEAQF